MNLPRSDAKDNFKIGTRLGPTAIALAVAVTCLAQNGREEKLIDLNVVAVDSHGQPVSDLTSEEFQVTDAGKRQQVTFFRHNELKLVETRTLGPHEFSNRNGDKVPHVTLVLFDLLNERFATRGYTANQIIREFETIETSANLYLYLLSLDGRLYTVHGFSASEGEEPGAAPWTRRIKPLMDDAMRTVTRVRPVDIDVNIRVQLTFNALDTIAAQLSRFPGRKNLVWVTDGVPIALTPQHSDTGDFVDFTPQLRQLSEQFDRSGVAIYPVRQVMLGSPDAMGAAYGSGLGSVETLDEFAGLTGGRATGSKDVGAAVREAITDVRTSYQIGYYPSPRNSDGKFHKLRVTCTRKGVRIQAKTGYYAWPEPPGAKAERAIDAAVSTGFDAAEIGIRGTMTPDAKDGRHVRLSLRIDANDVALAKEGEGYSGQLRLAFTGYQPNGKTMNSPIVPLDLNYNSGQRDRALKEGIEFTQELTLGEEVNRVRFVVFDRGSNAIGTLTIPLDSSVRGQQR